MQMERITLNPAVMGGKPCIRGLRVTVGTILGLLASGKSRERILQAYPYLEPADIDAALAYATSATTAITDSPPGRQPMTATVQQFLDSFDALPEADKHQAVVEILRRFAGAVEGDLPESTLVGAADELFRILDEEEAGHARR